MIRKNNCNAAVTRIYLFNVICTLSALCTVLDYVCSPDFSSPAWTVRLFDMTPYFL